jgi:hypothetical protein
MASADDRLDALERRMLTLESRVSWLIGALGVVVVLANAGLAAAVAVIVGGPR